MCYNISLTLTPERFHQIYGHDLPGNWGPGFFISAFDHPELPLLGLMGGKAQVFLGSWGLIPSWADKEQAQKLKKATLNARSEGLWHKPSFKQAIEDFRVLIPFTGFFEWQTKGKEKIPWLVTFQDPLMGGCLAGIASFGNTLGVNIPTFSLLTSEPNSLMGTIHDRSPLRIEKNDWAKWISPESTPGEIRGLMTNTPWEDMRAYPLGDLASRRGGERNRPEVLFPRPVDSQQSLF